MANKTRLPQKFLDRESYYIESDFLYYTTVHEGWTSLADDAGTTATVSDGIRGILALGTAATDNNEVGVRTTTELFLMDDNKPMWGYGRLQYTEANTDDANVLFGFISAFAANNLVDNGAGVRTTGNYAVWFKVDGETVWQVRSRNGSDTTVNVTNITAGGSDYHEFEVEVEEYTPTQGIITYKYDGNYARDTTTGERIYHKINYASATEMHFGAYVKAGDTNAETLRVDFLAASQVR